MPGGPPWLYRRFRDDGYRLTISRQAILGALSRTSKHLSAEDIYYSVHKRYPSVGLTTVYRTLELLVGMGIVFKFDFGDGRARYELAEGPNARRHHHLVCTNCGRVINYEHFVEKETSLLTEMEKTLSKEYNFNITTHYLRFSGLCDKCKQNE